MNVAVIDYKSGNIQSVLFALKREGIEGVLTSNPDKLFAADKVIFPGVGEASSTMEYLRSTGLDKVIVRLTKPVLGICLGMQLLCAWSEEGKTECLGVFPQNIIRFKNTEHYSLKIPHIGWNEIINIKGKLFKDIKPGAYLYFVHSYKAELGEFTSAECSYGEEFSAALERDNFYAVQFHPERSGEVGAQIFRNFLDL